VCERAVSDAREAGHRMIDTAAAYLNEEAVGRAMARWRAMEELYAEGRIRRSA